MRTSHTLGCLLALATFCPAAPAQDPDSPPQVRERVRRDVERKERLMREGKVVRSNVRITVRLKNGARLRGVVRNGRFIERHDGLQFVSADVAATGAGIRLWYHDRTNSYIFLPFEQIGSHTIGKVLTDEEVIAIGLELEAAGDRRRAEREAAQRDKPAVPPGVEPPAGAGGQTPPGATPPGGAPGTAEAGGVGPRLTPVQRALLDEFPPTAGWGPEKIEQLERDKIVIDRFPNKVEQRFIDNFAAWNEAYRIWLEIEEQNKAAEGAPGAEGVAPPSGAPGKVAPRKGTTGPGKTGPGTTGTKPPPGGVQGSQPPGGTGPTGSSRG